MGRHLVLIDLSENGGSVIDRLGFPAEQASRQTGDVASEGKLRSGADAYCKSGVVRRRESARTGAEIARDKSVCHFGGPRPHALKAKVTHWRLLSSTHALLKPHSRTDNAHQARLVPRLRDQKTFLRTGGRRTQSARIFRCLALFASDCCLTPARSCTQSSDRESASRMRTRVVSPRTLKVSASAAADSSVSGARLRGTYERMLICS